jgi:hypothetical protein
MAPPQLVSDLVERFERNVEAYKSPHYNEAQVRTEFVDPFFEALGWDVPNREGLAEAYKDVTREISIKVGADTKAPDYCFRIGGTPKFFLEAKKPAVNIKQDQGAAFQLRRYAWSRKLPLSLLTNFAELAIYDCRIGPPSQADAASKARTLYFTYRDYIEQWDEIAGRFSKDAVLRGSFDKYVETAKLKRGTTQVDAAFLEEIETWRKDLASNMALRNSSLTSYQLNFAVQRIIDRIIFLRICEDRGIEPYGQLREIQSGENMYQQLCVAFQRADDRYNSGLFQFQAERGRNEVPDTLTLTLRVSDDRLRRILRRLYYPESPYEFSVLPADILGQVYEQFLGKVIRLTVGHQARIEDKPEVKKAGGVFYTPKFIVDYIVEATVGKLVHGKSPRQVSKLRVLDPACGSGSFLIGAFQYLIDWHRDFYLADGPTKHTNEIYLGTGGAWRLTIAEKKRILLNNIFGVDIDPQAVEVTKLSLLLKVLEGESEETISTNLRLFHERALPDLGSNIKCGNSLVGSDFYKDKPAGSHDDDERRRINPFDWNTHFPEIMRAGGFDAVIGNPPYVLLQDKFRDDELLIYFRGSYAVASYKLDTYHLFIERGVSLTAPGGRFSMITPANFLTNNYLSPLRHFLLGRTQIDHILVIDGGVFPKVSVDNAILALIPGRKTTSFPLIRAHSTAAGLSESSRIKVDAPNDDLALLTGSSDKKLRRIWDKIERSGQPLSTLAYVNFGKQLRNRAVYQRDVIDVASVSAIRKPYRACYTGKDVSRYRVNWNGLACLDIDAARRGGCWDPNRQNAVNKLLTRQIGRYPEFGLDTAGHQCLNTIFMINLRDATFDPVLLLAVLNSRLVRNYWLDRFYDQRHTFPKIKGTYLEKLPIPRVDNTDRKLREKITALGQRMLLLHAKIASAKTDQEKVSLEREMDSIDHEIDRLVYEFYGLGEQEIATVENSSVPEVRGL